jgi:diacylglycerol kinase (ATP)
MYPSKDIVETTPRKRYWDIFNMKRTLRATLHALQGLKEVFFSEFAFQQECVVFVLALLVVCIADLSGLERALLVGSITCVLLVELLNTAVETIVDRISADHHPLSKKAKDIASAAVLISILQAMVIWLFIFFG